MEIYGTAVADKLDGNQGMLNRRYLLPVPLFCTSYRVSYMYLYLKLIILCRYYRQHCTLDFGSYTKDLSAICADLSSVFILDNSPGAYRAYPGKAIF